MQHAKPVPNPAQNSAQNFLPEFSNFLIRVLFIIIFYFGTELTYIKFMIVKSLKDTTSNVLNLCLLSTKRHNLLCTKPLFVRYLLFLLTHKFHFHRKQQLVKTLADSLLDNILHLLSFYFYLNTVLFFAGL